VQGGGGQGGAVNQGDRMAQRGRGGQGIGTAQGDRGQQRTPPVGQPARPVPMQPPVATTRTMIGMPNRPGVTVAPTVPASMWMRLEDQNLTAEIRATPLQQVLQELAARSGIMFEMDSQENTLVSVNFYRVSLQEAVQRLTASNNSISFYDRDESGQSRVRFVRIISRTPRSQSPSLRYIGTGEITKRGVDVIDTPEQALSVLANSTDLNARQKAIDALVSSKTAATVPALRVALSDPAPEVRVAAIEGLVSLGARETLPQILIALRDSHPGVRQNACLAVSVLGDAENVKNLRPLMRDQDASVAASADMAIRKLTARRP